MSTDNAIATYELGFQSNGPPPLVAIYFRTAENMNADTQEIVVVSGLPRSGTSLCMRMLEAGGVPVLTDRQRESDDDNPNGYYEFEPVKQTRQNASWLQSAQGKAVKMVYRLLYDLPSQYVYRVLFMRRDIQEILASQRKMLERNGKPTDSVDDAEMQHLFETELANCLDWMRKQNHLNTIEVSYNKLVEDPHSVLQTFDSFLARPLDLPAMARVINPRLYRNRFATSPAGQSPAQT